MLDAVLAVPPPRVDGGRGQATPAGEGGVDDLGGGEERDLGQHARPVQRRVVDQHGPQPVAEEQPPALGGSEAVSLGERLAVAGHGGGDDQHPGAGHLGPPAQVEVLAEVGDGRVEAAERGEEVGPHQGGRAGDAEDVANGVVLLLVELAALDGGDLVAGLVDLHADLEEPSGVVPGDQLRADDAGVGAVRLLHEGPHRVRLQGDVVVAQQVEGGALDDGEHLVGGGAEAGVVVEAADVGVGQHGGDPVGGIDLGVRRR